MAETQPFHESVCGEIAVCLDKFNIVQTHRKAEVLKSHFRVLKNSTMPVEVAHRLAEQYHEVPGMMKQAGLLSDAEAIAASLANLAARAGKPTEVTFIVEPKAEGNRLNYA